MLAHINNFIQGITSFEYETPIYIQIISYLSLAVFATCILLLFRDTLNNSIFKDSYMFYYTIVIINIVNIILILYYYKSKSGTFIGEEGEIGGTGLKGNIGTEIDCSLCSNNLFLKKTQSYNKICKLNTNQYLTRLLGNTSNNSTINKLMKSKTFNYEQFATSLLVNGFDLQNPTVINILNYINAFEFLLYNNVNISMGISHSNITGIFVNPDVPLGYYSLGDSILANDNEQITTYALNGDIILPEGFNQICTFTTFNDKNNVESYGIYKMIPPILTKFEPDNISNVNRDISKKPKNDEYISLGYVIAPLTISSSPSKELYACVKQSCCKIMKDNSLKFMFLYPAVGFTDSDLVLDESNTTSSNTTSSNTTSKKTKHNNTNNVMGMFSVWKTPYNTLFVKYIDTSKIVNGMTIIEQLYLNMNTNEINANLYTRYGTIKKVIKERVKENLRKIKLEKIVILGILFNHTFELIIKKLKIYYTKYIGSGTMEIANTSLLKKLLSTSSDKEINYNDIHLLLNEIGKSIDITKKELAKMETNINIELKKKRILGFGEIENANNKENKNGISYLALKEYQQLKTTVAELAVNVENSDNLLDILESIFDSGINYILELDDLTYSQKIILYTCTCLLKPNEDLYIIKNSCLVYEQLDENRVNLENNVSENLKRFTYLRNYIGSNAEKQCGKRDLTSINKLIDTTYQRLINNSGHITNALTKLNNLDLSEFTINNLEFILVEMQKLIIFIESKCS